MLIVKASIGMIEDGLIEPIFRVLWEMFVFQKICMSFRELMDNFLCFNAKVSVFQFHYRCNWRFMLIRIAHAVNVIDSIQILWRVRSRVDLVDTSSYWSGWTYCLSIRQQESCMCCINMSIRSTMGTCVQFNVKYSEVRVIFIKPDELFHIHGVDIGLVTYLIYLYSHTYALSFASLYIYLCRKLLHGPSFISDWIIRYILLSVQN